MLQPRVDRLALESEHAEHALMHASERLSLHEPFEPLDPEGELAKRERSFAGQAPLTQPLEMLGQSVFGAVDDPEILTSATFDCGLQQTT